MDYICKKVSFNEIERLNPSFEASFKLLKGNIRNSVYCAFDAAETVYLKEDLIMIDSKMPEILADIALDKCAVQNKIKIDTFLEYKIKDFLMYVFFNSTPDKIIFSNYGDKGFLALKNNKEILHFPNLNLSEFRSALLLKADFNSTLYKNQKEKSKRLKFRVTFGNKPVL